MQSPNEKQLKRIQEHLKNGEKLFAFKKLKRLVSSAPHIPEANYLLSSLFAERGDPESATRYLKQAVEQKPKDPQYRAGLGMLLFRSGNVLEALPAFQKACELSPQTATYHLYEGCAHYVLKDDRQAEICFRRMVKEEPTILKPEFYAQSSGQMRKLLDTAYRVLGERQRTLVNDILGSLPASDPSDLQRLKDCFECITGQQTFKPNHELQQPTLLKFPDLAPRPWFERSEFPWLTSIEEQTDTIRSEYAQVVGQNADLLKPYFEQGDRATDTFSDLIGKSGWQSMHLLKFGRVEENCQKFPETMAILDSLPLARAGVYFPEVVFSVLGADAVIPPHHGLSNTRLAVHLPLIVPEACSITVGEETRQWVEGECLIFDDSFIHTAQNKSELPRLVLIFEIWNPELSDLEINGIQQLMEKREELIGELNA